MSRAKVTLLTQIIKECSEAEDIKDYIFNLWASEIDNLRTIEEIKKNKKNKDLVKYYDFE